jgi:hypothetical protein
MEREWQVKVSESDKGNVVASLDRTRSVGQRDPQHVLGEMLGDVIVAMAPDDAANVLFALIRRMDVLGDESLKPFGQLATFWRVWQTRGDDMAFSQFANVEENYE